MKKINKAVLLLLLFTLVSSICFAAPKKKLDPLDEAIRETSDYLNTNLPKGSKIVILNIQSENHALSEYIIDELISNAINDKVFLVVDRQQLDAIRAEQNFQFSGEVDDKQALEIGKFFGASSIVSGAVNPYGKDYRLRVRALEVQTALVQGQFNKNITKSTAITTLLSTKSSAPAASASSNTKQTTPAALSTNNKTQTTQTVQVPSQSNTTTKSQSNVIVVQGATLTEKLQWLETNAANNTEYRIEVTGNESLSAPILSYPGKRNVTIRLISSGGERVLSLTGSGSLFTIEADITLILDNGITLRGREKNTASLVIVNGRGKLIMNTGAKIIGNSGSNSNGIFINQNGIFDMKGGEISNNNSSGRGGGGVYVNTSGTFTMSGGEIINNRSSQEGGGVFVKNGNFTLNGGTIANNKGDSGYYWKRGGGGIYIEDGRFIFSSGEIYGNSAINGGGVFLFSGTFTMSGGEISANTTTKGSSSGISSCGGGVCITGGKFSKTGGVIYGSEGTSNDNIAGNGHVVYCSIGSKRNIRNNTAGSKIKLDNSIAGAAGGWEN